MKNATFLHFELSEFDYGPEMDYFYSEIGLEVTFGTILENRRRKIPTSGCTARAQWQPVEGGKGRRVLLIPFKITILH